jgi:hypothetical protein
MFHILVEAGAVFFTTRNSHFGSVVKVGGCTPFSKGVGKENHHQDSYLGSVVRVGGGRGLGDLLESPPENLTLEAL